MGGEGGEREERSGVGEGRVWGMVVVVGGWAEGGLS